MDMNPPVSEQEQLLLSKLLSLQRKHIVIHSLGRGVISLITRKNDLSGAWVYFKSEQKGEVKVDGEAFLNGIIDILPIPI